MSLSETSGTSLHHRKSPWWGGRLIKRPWSYRDDIINSSVREYWSWAKIIESNSHNLCYVYGQLTISHFIPMKLSSFGALLHHVNIHLTKEWSTESLCHLVVTGLCCCRTRLWNASNHCKKNIRSWMYNHHWSALRTITWNEEMYLKWRLAMDQSTCFK